MLDLNAASANNNSRTDVNFQAMFGSQFHRAVCCVVFFFNIISFPCCLYILIRQAPSRRQAGHRLRINSVYVVALYYNNPPPIVPLREDTPPLVLSCEPPPLVASLPVSSEHALVDLTESEHMLSAVLASLRFLLYFPSIVAHTQRCMSKE